MNGWIMKLCVCGGRSYDDADRVFRVLDKVNSKRPIAELVHGACPTGADFWAAKWANARGVKQTAFPADWGGFGRRAGPIRNQQMVDYKIDGLVAFPGGKGTSDMKRRCLAAGVTVMSIE